MQANDWCIDVPDSPLYNRIVDRSLAKAPGLDRASEPMRRDLQAKPDDLYEVGFVIEHNAQATPQGGSCIFAHVQRGIDMPTAGLHLDAGRRVARPARVAARGRAPGLRAAAANRIPRACARPGIFLSSAIPLPTDQRRSRA